MENDIIYCVKSLQPPNMKTREPTKAIYTAIIHSYEDQTFDEMNEESEEKKHMSTLSFEMVTSH